MQGFEWEMSLRIWTFGPQLLMLSGEVTEPSGGGALLEEYLSESRLWGFIALTNFSLLSLFSTWGWDVGSQFPDLPFCCPDFSTLMDISPSRTISQNKYFCKYHGSKVTNILYFNTMRPESLRLQASNRWYADKQLRPLTKRHVV